MARIFGLQRSDTQRLEQLLVEFKYNRNRVDTLLQMGRRLSYAHVFMLETDGDWSEHFTRTTKRLQQIKAKLMVQGLWT